MKYLHTMVRVKNLEQSLDFYCHKLGLVETKRVENKVGKFTLIFLAAAADITQAQTYNSPTIELTYNWDNSNDYNIGNNFGHLAFSVANIYETCQHLLDNGVIINRPPRDGHMAFIKSPDGISIELLQTGAALPVQAPWVDMKNIGSW